MNKIIDLHQDLMLYVSKPELYKDKKNQTSFEALVRNNIKITIVSGFALPENEKYRDPSTHDLIEKDLKSYINFCKKNKDFIIVKNKKDLNRVIYSKNLYGLILHIEGLNFFNQKSSWKKLEKWYRMGLRSIGPLWNINNSFGGGTLYKKRGLTAIGKKLLRWSEKKGVIFDFAHMNEKTFWQCSRLAKKPILISHGNSRTVCQNVRNYTDEQLKKVSETNGTVGIFFSKKFISSKKEPLVEDIVKHIDRIKLLCGVDSISIGSDFGGIISGFAKGMESVDELPRFRRILLKHGYSKIDVEKIFFGNAKRVLESLLN